MSVPNPNPRPAAFPRVSQKDVSAEESARVSTLIAAGDSRQAVDIAKQVHGRCQNAASEALLIDAYVARISALIDRNLLVEGKMLMDLVRRRYPASRERLRQMTALLLTGKGDLQSLVQPLNDSSLSPEKRAAIYSSIHRHVADLGALALSSALPVEHPLRVSAAALVKGFEAVTSGPVDEAALLLPEISRQSPLAPWKMLLRAIAAFYRREDELCRKCLTAIEPDSAAARLAPALHSLMGEKAALTPAAVVLVTQVGKNSEVLRSRLQKLEHLLHRGSPGPVLKEIRETVAVCKQSCPDLLGRLQQHIFLLALDAGLESYRVNSALGGGFSKDAYFWRLIARSKEADRGTIFFACALWEEFRKHALHETWFPGKGPEIAALYLHMESLLRRLPHDQLPSLGRKFAASFPGLIEYYRDQPPEIRSLATPKGKDTFYYLDPSLLLERACEADPCEENFRRWFDRTRSEPVAWRWRVAFPNDARPLLKLMEFAEKKKALQKAFKFLKQAEELDGVNPAVRKARLRLLVSTTVDHLRRNKARQAELDLADIEALPQVQQGDRLAFVAALRWVSCMKWGSEAEVLRVSEDVVRLLSSVVAAQMVISGVARMCKLDPAVVQPASPPANEALIPAVSRACSLAEDIGFGVHIPQEISSSLIDALSANIAMPETPGLMAVGEVALRMNDLALAYALSTAGLVGNPASQARYLFLRARALLSRDAERHDACLRAASELARRNRDHDLLDKIGKWREQLEIDSLDAIVNLGSMSTEEVNRILELERGQRALPAQLKVAKTRRRQQCDCPACSLERGELPPGFEEFEAMVEKYGPETVARALDDIFNERGSRKRGKRNGGPEREFNDFDIFRERL